MSASSTYLDSIATGDDLERRRKFLSNVNEVEKYDKNVSFEFLIFFLNFAVQYCQITLVDFYFLLIYYKKYDKI